MRTKLLRSLLPLALMLTMISCSTEDTSAPSGTDSEIVDAYEYNSEEQRLMTAINNYRDSIGLGKLDKINYISHKSQEHNFYMMEQGQISHDFFQQRSADLINHLGAERVGENIAYNYRSPEGAFAAWLNSPGHKANIEGDYTNFGVAITADPLTGRRYFTNMFIKK